ncbi:hypothetical protein J6E39_03765 [bacterium]|nr:hypothetical protein [bacterium]
MDYELNLSIEELEKRTHKDYLATKKMLEPDAVEYTSLADGDKEALKYLVKAGDILEKINMQLDNKENLGFKKFLDDEIAKGNRQAELTKILFDAQKGVCALDRETNQIELIKGVHVLPGKGLYPVDLTKEEFHKILIKMIKEGKTDEVKKILNQRSVIERSGDELKATDYIDYFKEDFSKMADYLDKAAKVSTNTDFNEFLHLQAEALRKADPMLDAYADKKWATLQDTPLEFTITRENYADEMTESVIENAELKKLLDENKIEVISKDFLGARIGIVNKKGTEDLLKIKNYLPLIAYNMPYKDEYEQNIKPVNEVILPDTNSQAETKQTMVDVDLVQVNGDVGEYRAGITLAENLPNDDKLSLTIGGGRRNVYHRQIRFISDYEKLQKRLDTLLDKEQHKYYLNEADHWFTIGHENTHSLGPNKGTEALGKYKSIIEENKADMGALAFLDLLVEKGMYTKEQAEQMIVTFAADNFLKSKPTLSQAHRVRTVMQTKYFIENGAIELTADDKIHVNIEKMVPTAKKMLEQIVRIQIDGDFSKAKKYVLDNFIWTDEMEKISHKMKEIDKNLNGRVEAKLAQKLLNE